MEYDDMIWLNFRVKAQNIATFLLLCCYLISNLSHRVIQVKHDSKSYICNNIFIIQSPYCVLWSVLDWSFGEDETFFRWQKTNGEISIWHLWPYPNKVYLISHHLTKHWRKAVAVFIIMKQKQGILVCLQAIACN